MYFIWIIMQIFVYSCQIDSSFEHVPFLSQFRSILHLFFLCKDKVQGSEVYTSVNINVAKEARTAIKKNRRNNAWRPANAGERHSTNWAGTNCPIKSKSEKGNIMLDEWRSNNSPCYSVKNSRIYLLANLKNARFYFQRFFFLRRLIHPCFVSL